MSPCQRRDLRFVSSPNGLEHVNILTVTPGISKNDASGIGKDIWNKVQRFFFVQSTCLSVLVNVLYLPDIFQNLLFMMFMELANETCFVHLWRHCNGLKNGVTTRPFQLPNKSTFDRKGILGKSRCVKL